ncbi:MAG: hypothetical protein QXQ29_05445 [Candidatus Bathyarchaeia archaeon]
MVHVKLKSGCSGGYLSELESIISSTDRKAISIQPCISDEGYMVRYPPMEGIGEPDFNIVCKLIRTLYASRTICNLTLRVGRIDDGNVVLTLTHNGELIIQRIRRLEDAAIYASRGYRIILLASRCRLCGFRIFECMIGLCSVCLEKLEFDDERSILSENVRELLSNLARISESGLGEIEEYLEDQLRKISEIIWLAYSIDEAILYASIILSMMNLYSKIHNAKELKKITDYLNEVCYSDDIEEIINGIVKLCKEKGKMKL